MRIIILFSTLFIAACTVEKNYYYFLEHPEKLQSSYDECWVKSVQQVVLQKECQVVAKVLADLKPYMMRARFAPEEFGEDILRLQMKLDAEQTDNLQLEEKKNSDSYKKIQEDELRLKRMLVVIHLLGMGVH